MKNKLINSKITTIALCAEGINALAKYNILKSEDAEVEKMKDKKCEVCKELETACKCSVKKEEEKPTEVTKTEEVIVEVAEVVKAEVITEVIEVIKSEVEIVKAESEAILKAKEDEILLLKAQIDKAEDEKLENIYKAKANEFTHLSVDGLVLKSIAKALPNEYAKIEAILKQANNLLQENNKIMEQIGKANNELVNLNDHNLAIETIAKSIQTRTGITIEKARVEALKSPEGIKIYNKLNNWN